MINVSRETLEGGIVMARKKGKRKVVEPQKKKHQGSKYSPDSYYEALLSLDESAKRKSMKNLLKAARERIRQINKQGYGKKSKAYKDLMSDLKRELNIDNLSSKKSLSVYQLNKEIEILQRFMQDPKSLVSQIRKEDARFEKAVNTLKSRGYGGIDADEFKKFVESGDFAEMTKYEDSDKIIDMFFNDFADNYFDFDKAVEMFYKFVKKADGLNKMQYDEMRRKGKVAEFIQSPWSFTIE